MLIKVLVVDDSASDSLIIKSMLSDYKVFTAFDGEEALRVLAENDGINLLILDLNMPKMNGFQVLEALNQDERFRKLRIIILTNSDELDNEIKGLKLGAVDYIRKPINMDSLKARMDVHVALLRAEHALEEKLKDQTISFEVIFEQAPIGIAILNSNYPQVADRVILKANSMFEQIAGRTKEEVMALGWEKFTHPDDLEATRNNFRKLQSGDINSYSIEARLLKPDKSIVWVYMIVAALAQEGEKVFNTICLLQDISESKKIQAERKYISEHDRLTGLSNRESLKRMLAKNFKNKNFSKMAFVGVNLSNIHLLTVDYGFVFTQALIKKAAEVLGEFCSDTRLLFQTYESRFVFYILDYKDKNELIDLSDAIVKSLVNLFVGERIGAGIGILELEEDDPETDVDLLLRRLLIASEKSVSLFENKFGTCFYNADLEAAVNRERDIIESLSAIAAGDSRDEIFLQYQPIIDLHTNSVCSFEALARLKTDKFGLVLPLEFIPIAEKTRLIISIGEKIIVNAFQFLNMLKSIGYDEISVSINVSPIQLFNPGFSKRLFELIAEMEVDPKNICIEITESVFVYDNHSINKIMDNLRKAGILVAIDDFGTGYSSLAREKQLHVDYLKIDKFFIDKLFDATPDKAITSDIISMSHKLGQCTIAEGVYCDSQLQYLKEYSCDRVQGFLISKPLDQEAAIDFLRKRNI